jgi:uncharacterized protein YecE (DUF72 family)
MAVKKLAPLIGCAGWSLRAEHQPLFPPGDSHLARYAGRFNAVEINSSFYRPHLPATYRRWHDSVPADFRFSVKVPKAITHQARLASCDALLTQFLHEAGHLQDKLGCLLVQLPPSLAFDAVVANAFFVSLRGRVDCAIACEPRHGTWQSEDASALLKQHGVARVAIEPDVVSNAPLAYFRLHGAPVMYKSAYTAQQIEQLAANLAARRAAGKTSWCIFDNTALGAATLNASALSEQTS